MHRWLSSRGAFTAGLLAMAMFVGACGNGENAGDGGGQQGKGPITVGVSSAFAENQIVAEMYAQLLESAGYEVERQLDLESREISQPALEKGDIDLKPEYLGTMLLALDQKAKVSSDPDSNEEQLRKLLEPKDLVLLERMEANDTNALVVTKTTAERRNLSKVSDLEPIAGQLTLGGPPECPERPFCIPGFKQTYGIDFKEFKPLDVGGPITVQALEGGEVDVALLFSTSGSISKKGFVLLEDDKGLQTADNIAPIVRRDVLTDEIEELLNSVKLNTKQITELNAKVEVDKEDPAEVAKQFLGKEGLL